MDIVHRPIDRFRSEIRKRNHRLCLTFKCRHRMIFGVSILVGHDFFLHLRELNTLERRSKKGTSQKRDGQPKIWIKFERLHAQTWQMLET